MSRMKAGFWRGVLVVWSGLLLGIPVAQAQVTSSWNGTTGYWDDASKWDKGVPLAGTNAFLGGGGNYTVTYTNPMSAAIGALIITNTAGTTTLDINTNGFRFNGATWSFAAVNVNPGGVVTNSNAINLGTNQVLTIKGGTFAAGGNVALGSSLANTLYLNVYGGSFEYTVNSGSFSPALTQTGGVVRMTSGCFPSLIASTISGGVFSNINGNALAPRSSTITLTNQGQIITSGLTAGGSTGGETIKVDGGSIIITGTRLVVGSVNASGSSRGSTLIQTAGVIGMTDATGLIIGTNAPTGNSSIYEYQMKGGVLSVPQITLGDATDLGTNINALTVSGGTINLGSGGITMGAAPAATNRVWLSGGELGAQANWSSSFSMTLTNTPGPGLVTFRASDTNGVSRDITLSGALTGNGGFIKTGGGALQLNGTHTFSGNSIVSNGILRVTGVKAGSGALTIAGGMLSGAGTLAGTVTNRAIISANGIANVGTMTITNLVMAENSAYTWNYGDSGNDLIDVKGFLTLPNVATVTVSRATGSVNPLPASATLFTAPVINNPAGVSGWVITGALPTSRVRVTGNQIQLVTPTGWVMYVN